MEIHHGWELVDKERRAEQVYGAAGADIVARLAARASVHSAVHGVALKCGLLERCNGADLLHVRSRAAARSGQLRVGGAGSHRTPRVSHIFALLVCFRQEGYETDHMASSTCTVFGFQRGWSVCRRSSTCSESPALHAECGCVTKPLNTLAGRLLRIIIASRYMLDKRRCNSDELTRLLHERDCG